jgi:hypothetical protein
MANPVILNTSVQYTPPAAPVGSGLSSFALQALYNAQQVGQIDVPAGTAPSTVFNVAFGYVNAAKLLIVRNLMSSDVAIRINGSVDPNFCLSPGGLFVYGGASDPSTNPLTSVSVTVLSSPTVLEFIQTFVYGD